MGKFCRNCKHLNMLEEEQGFNSFPSAHICRKYKKVIKHGDFHPDLVRTKKCKVRWFWYTISKKKKFAIALRILNEHSALQHNIDKDVGIYCYTVWKRDGTFDHVVSLLNGIGYKYNIQCEDKFFADFGVKY